MAMDMYVKFSCTYCLDDMIGIRVKCAVCPNFDLCLQCFSAGAEIGPHKNDHAYQFVGDPGSILVFGSKNGKWTVSEELQLLNGIAQYGYGNWERISERIETRSAEEAKEEYLLRYVEGNIGRCTWGASYKKRASLKDFGPDLTVETPTPAPLIDVAPEYATLLGYMPLRGDYEREFHNDAELLISKLNVPGSDDDDLDIALKLVHVDMYMEVQRERVRKRKIVQDYQLIPKFFAERKERPLRRGSNIEQEVEDKLKCFCTYHTVTKHQALVRSLQRQRELQQRLSELLRYRRAGLTRLEELAHYEQELARSRGSGSSWEHSHPKDRKRKREDDEEENTPFSTTKSCTSPTDSRPSSPEQEQPQQRPRYTVIPEPNHLLSRTEAQLCTSLKLTPSQFISMKTFFIMNPLAKTFSTTEEVVQKHIISNGWFASKV